MLRFFFTLFFILIISNIKASLLDKPAVLILHSYHKGLSWTENLNNGIEKVFKSDEAIKNNIQIDYEYMDTKRFSSDKYYSLLYDVFKYKYKGKKKQYSVIVACDDNAFNFLLKYRNDLFGKIPVVFCGLNFFDKKSITDHVNYTGVVEAFDVKSTIDLIIDFQKNLKKIVVVGDQTTSSDMDRRSLKVYESYYKKLGVSFIYLESGNILEYLEELSKLSNDSAVLAMHLNRDSNGEFYTFEESFDIYSKVIKVPIYSFWDFYLGRGIVGGMIISGDIQGQSAALKAIQILKGQKVQNIPIQMKSPNQYMFDYKMLKQHGISLGNIPKGSIVINKPFKVREFFELYKEVMVKILIVILILIIIIFFLVINILKRIAVKKKLMETNVAFGRFVPHKFLENIDRSHIIDVQLGDNSIKRMSILFLKLKYKDIRDKSNNEVFVNIINSLKEIGPLVNKYNGFIDKYMGDIVVGIFPNKSSDAVNAAIQITGIINNSNSEITIDIGLHIGNVMIGTVGESERMEGTIISDSVNLASRLCGLNNIFGSNIILSKELYDELDPQDYQVRSIGRVSVKGKALPVDIYEVIIDNNKTASDRKVFEEAIESFSKGEMEKAFEKFEKIVLSTPGDCAAKFYKDRAAYYMKNGLPENWSGVEKINSK